jgi:hypothetical protein
MAIQWSNWASLGKPPETEIGRPFAQSNQDGRLEVFALGQGEIFNVSQASPNGAWREGWHNKGRPSSDIGIKTHVVGRNADGRLEIFAFGDDNLLWQKWQVAPNNGWVDGWKSMGRPAPFTSFFPGQFTVGSNQDGRQELFAVAPIDSDILVFQNWQTAPNGGWSGWRALFSHPIPAGGSFSIGVRESRQSFPPGSPDERPADRLTVGRNEDGRQELFVIMEDDALWHIWQVFPNAGWSDWESLGKPRDDFPEPKDRDLFQPIVQKNADGHLEVFAPGNGAFCNRWQERPLDIPVIKWRGEGWNAKPRPKPEVGLTWLEAALNVGGQLDRKLEVCALGDDGALWHAWQIDQAPNWSPWESLGSPPARIRAADHLTIGINQDGRLEVFLVGQDGAVWHIWQTR